MNGEQMYKFLSDIGEEGRKGILDVTWWDILTIRGIIDDMFEDADSWLSGLSEKERKTLTDTSDEELADALEEALNEVDGDGEHSNRIIQVIRESLIRKTKDKCKTIQENVDKKPGCGVVLDSLVFNWTECERFVKDNFGKDSEVTAMRIFDRISGFMHQYAEWPEDDWYGIDFDSGEMLDVNIFGTELSDFNENITLYPVKKIEGSERPEIDTSVGYDVYQQ